MAEGLRAIEEAAGDPETVNSVFRAVHSIKGGAGAFGLDALVQFAHGFETTLDLLRSGKIEAEPNLNRILMHAGDHLSDLVAAAREERDADEATSARLLEELETASGGPTVEEEIAFAPMALSFDFDLPAGPATETISIRFRPTKALYANGNDPSLLFRDLATLGPVTAVLDDSALPPLADLDWQDSHLAWDLTVETDRGIDTVREVFEFVEGLCELEIAVAGVDQPAAADRAAEPAADDPEAAAGPGADAVALGDLEPADTAPEISEPAAKPPGPAKPAAARASDEPAKAGPARARPTIRVDLDRVDRLINVVGELVINQAMLAQAIESTGLGGVGSDVGHGA